MRALTGHRGRVWLLLLLSVAFGLRLTVGVQRFYFGADALALKDKNWWNSGYSQYGELAISLARGRGLNAPEDGSRIIFATRPPLYPLLLAALYFMVGQSTFFPLFLHSLIGTATVFFVYLIGRRMFGHETGSLAAAMATFYPYYVAHDTALQETALFTFLMAGVVYTLLKAIGSKSLWSYALAGICVGLAILCKESTVVMIPLLLIWVYLNGGLGLLEYGKRVLVLIGMVLLLVSPWLIRNARVYGSPGLSIGIGVRVWAGNNPFVLDYYPRESIDKSVEKGAKSIPEEERSRLRKMGVRERDRWFLNRGLDFMKKNPEKALKLAMMKMYAALSPFISPEGDNALRRVMYTISYSPVLILAIVGAFLSRKRWREVCIFYFLFFSFLGVTIMVFAHTAHRVYLDVYLMVLASHAALWILKSLFGSSGKAKTPAA